MTNTITIIDYGLGNLASVGNALKKLEIPYQISSDPDVLKKATALILPGVGSARQGMKNLKEKRLDTIITEEVENGKPILGICLGMQLLLSTSEEGNVPCLGLIKGKVKKFQTKLKIPQIGWNEIRIRKYALGIMDKSYMYFVNSYICVPENPSIIAATTDYDGKFCSAFVKNNIVGVQFHPEKSGDTGLQLLKFFWEVTCK